MIASISNCSSITISSDSSLDTMPQNPSQLAFHIQSDDYFPYLSALLGFVEETLAAGDGTDECVRIQVEAIRATRGDLQYLQDHFRIEARP